MEKSKTPTRRISSFAGKMKCICDDHKCIKIILLINLSIAIGKK